MRTILLVLLLLAISTMSFALDRTLAWEPSPTDGVQGYYLYYTGIDSGGQTGSIPANINANGEILYVLDTTDLHGDYTFHVTAYNQDGESLPSNPVTSFLGVPEGVGDTLYLQ